MNQPATFFEQLARIDREHWLRFFIIVVLSVVSFYTSFDGVSRYLSMGETGASASQQIFLALMVFMIQLLLIIALSRLSRPSSWFNKLLWLSIYLLVMGISVFFSFAFYTGLLQAENYAVENFNRQLNNTVMQTQVYQNSFTTIEETSQTLAAYSLDTSKVERLKGGTCGVSQPGAGPRRDLRDQEAQFFSQISDNITRLREKTTAHLHALHAIKQAYQPDSDDIAGIQQQMNALIAKVNQQQRSGVISQIKRDLQAHTGEARRQLWVESRQQMISCPDRKISTAIDALLADIDTLPVLATIALFDATDDQAVMERAGQVFIALPSLLQEFFFAPAHAEQVGQVEQEPVLHHATAITHADMMPIIVASVVDLIIFAVGFSSGMKAHQQGYLKGVYFGEYFSSRDIEKIVSVFGLSAQQWRYIFRQHFYSREREYYLIVPSDVHPLLDYSANLIDLIESLAANRRLAVPKWKNIPLSKLPRRVQNSFSQSFQQQAQDAAFDFYPLTEDQWHDWVQSINAHIIGEETRA